ncbi:hypothetical protein BDR26DRAFT_54242 [Obelidium mucronatum]|nr:hypothetical protein BDR26DRAFT_54242 [Obelidium mucronatum]
MNIHRWRKLSGSDPSTYELITKIQTLQKRLIAKTEEVLEKELVINQKEKLYREVKDVLQRQPGPEVVEELRVVKDAVRVKMRECKALASELNMYHSQVNEYKFEIDRLTRDQQELKKKYYEQKKKEREDRLRKQRYEHSSSQHPGGVVSERMGGLVGLFGDQAIGVTMMDPQLFNPKHHHRLAGMPIIKPNLNFTNKKYSGGGFNMAMFSSGIQHNIESLDSTGSNAVTKLPELQA